MSSATKKMSLMQATMLVAGNMIGTGVFLLPVSMASVGGIAVFGWLVATAGALALALVFAKLGELDPQEGGPYAYARDFLGPYIGFQTNYIYWFANWIGNVAIAVAVVGYLAEFIPHLTSPKMTVFATIVVIWALTVANILGPRVIGALEAWTVSLALVPILAIAFLGWFWFDPEIFKAGWNVIGTSNTRAIARAASIALWAFMGVESAAVSAGVIENPKRNIPLATLLGLAISAVVYLLSCTAIMGIIPNAQLRSSHAPFAEAARMVVGTPGMVIIGLCAILKSLGALGGWMLLVGQSAKAAANDGMFPRIFGRTNRHGVPGLGLAIVSILMTAVVFATMSPTIADQFDRIINFTIILVVVPYIYASVAVVKEVHDHVGKGRTFTLFKIVALAAVSYCLWTVLGGDPSTVVQSLVVLLLSVPFYPFFIGSMKKAASAKKQLATATPSFQEQK